MVGPEGSFLARSVVSRFEVWQGVSVQQNEGGLSPRFPGCRIDVSCTTALERVSNKRLQF